MADVTAHREPVVDQMVEVWGSLVAACDRLGEHEWALPTDCPGWSVKDQLSHLVGIERMLLGDPPPPSPTPLPDHVHNEVGSLNEAWVDQRRAEPGHQVLAELVATIGRRTEALGSLGPEEFDRVGWSPVGEVPYRRFLETRILDTWAHEQDVRRALSRPGGRDGAGEQVVLEWCERSLPFVVGKRVAPPDGCSVLLVVTGTLGRHVLVAVEAGRAAPVPVGAAGPTVALTIDQESLWRLAFGRVDPARVVADGRVQVDGDLPLGYRVLDSMVLMT
jgi:uncharacterized protein (TIGR03083 family)